MRSMLLPLSGVIFLVACQSTNPDGSGQVPVNEDGGDDGLDTGLDDGDEDGGDDGTGDDGGDDEPDTCEDLDLSAGTITVDEACDATPSDPTPTLEWSDNSLGGTLSSPVVGHLTDDDGNGFIGQGDVPDIVIQNMYNEVIAMSGDGSGVHWTQDTLGGMTFNDHPALGDVDLDGEPEVVAMTIVDGDYGLVALDGATGAIEWESSISSAFFHPVHGAIQLADLEGDGTVEVILGNAVLAGEDGTLLWAGEEEDGKGNLICEVGYTQDRRVLPTVADVDGDGVAELVTGLTTYGPDGTIEANGGATDGSTAVVQLDDDEELEVVLTYSYSLCSDEGAIVRVQDRNGTEDWEVQAAGFLGGIGTPTIADVDGDGYPDIIVTRTIYAAGTGYLAELWAIDRNGDELWAASLPVNHTYTGSGSLSAVDLDGDGASELIVQGWDGVMIFDGPTGTLLGEVADIESNNTYSTPALADVDGDGHMEVVVTGRDAGQTYTDGGVYVIGGASEDWPTSESHWTQQNYVEGSVDGQLAVQPPVTPGGVFRGRERTPLAAHDAVALDSQICTAECDAGVLEIVGRVGSAGTEALPAGTSLSLEVQEEDGSWTTLETQLVPAGIDAGTTSEGLVFTVDPDEVGTAELRLAVGDLDEAQCSEVNDVVLLGASLCE